MPILFFVGMPLLVAAAGFDALNATDTPVRNGHFYSDGRVASGAGFRITDDGGALFWQGYEQQGGRSTLGHPISRRFVCGGDLCQATEYAVLRWSMESGSLTRASIRRELLTLGYAEDSLIIPDGLFARAAGYIPPAALEPERLSDDNVPDLPALSRTAQSVAQAASPSVVKIEVGHDDFGSGVIFDPSGYILTNQHVVASAPRVKVVLHDGRRVGGTVVGSDPTIDVAVVKIDEGGLPATVIGSSAAVREGDEIVLIGHTPLLDASHYARTGTVRFAGQVHAHGLLPSVIQTDAFVHPGDSGGPLLNIRGELIGLIDSMTPARNSPRALRSNALSIDSVMPVADRLLNEAGYSP